MYANGSSFEANLTLQNRNSFRDVSFSSYLNKAEENMVRMLANQASELPNDHHYRVLSEDDKEIDVFGAEKYFKGEIEDGGNNNNLTFIDTINTTRKMHHQDQKLEEFDHNLAPKLRDDQTNMHTSTVRSYTSCNSRSGLLPINKQSPGKTENRSKTRTFFARFGCNCMNKKSTQIDQKQFIQPKTVFESVQKDHKFSSKLKEKKTRNEYFSFPVLNSNSDTNSSSNSKSGNLAGNIVKVDDDNNSNNKTGRLSVGKKLSLLNDLEDEMYNTSSRMYNNDVDSDSSSDLFEIESFSPTGESLGQRKSNCYAPSEVSIEWSVVTASAADFSVVSEHNDGRNSGGGGRRNSGWNSRVEDTKDEQKRRLGILSGCMNHKALRVARDEGKVGGSGAGGRRRLSEFRVVGSRGGNEPSKTSVGSACLKTKPIKDC